VNWKTLNSLDQLDQIFAESYNHPIGIFKHSTTCPISAMAKKRFEKQWTGPIDVYYLDLLSFRSISNAVAEKSEVIHQSPQFIVISGGKAVYDASHLNIEMEEVETVLESASN
jgi:bacillithiol system protein YtxJ